MTVQPLFSASQTPRSAPKAQALPMFGASAGHSTDSVRFSGKGDASGSEKSNNPFLQLINEIRSLIEQIKGVFSDLLSSLGLGAGPKAEKPARRNTVQDSDSGISINHIQSPLQTLWESASGEEEQAYWANTDGNQKFALLADTAGKQALEILERPEDNNLIITSEDEGLRDGFVHGLLNKLQDEATSKSELPFFTHLSPVDFMNFQSHGIAPHNNPDLYPSVIRERHGMEAEQSVYYVLDNPDWATVGVFMNFANAVQQQDPNVRFIFRYSRQHMINAKQEMEAAMGKTLPEELDMTAHDSLGGFNTVALPETSVDQYIEFVKDSPLLGQAIQVFFTGAPLTENGLREMLTLIKNNGFSLTFEALLEGMYRLAQVANEAPNTPASVDQGFVQAHQDELLEKLTQYLPFEGDNASSGVQQLSGGQQSGASFEVINPESIRVRLKDVVGMEKTKQILQLVIDEQKYPDWYARQQENDPDGGKRGILLYGPPGNGKTMIAKAVAGELGGTFINCDAALTQVYKGSDQVNANQIKEAIKTAPTDLVVVFVDEIDGAGNRDNSNENSGDQVTQWLKLMEGLQGYAGKKVVFMAATNKRDNMDNALFERFSRHVDVPNPTPSEAQQILENQFNYKLLKPAEGEELNWDVLQKQLRDLSGRNLRDIAQLLQDTLNVAVSDEEKATAPDSTLHFTQSQLLQAIDDFKTSRDDRKKGDGVGFTALYDEASGRLISAS